MTMVVWGLAAVILTAMAIAQVLRVGLKDVRVPGLEEAAQAAVSQIEAVRPTSAWLRTYARKYREAQQAQDEARLMLYGMVQKARAEGLTSKRVVELTGLSDSSVRRITSQTRVSTDG